MNRMARWVLAVCTIVLPLVTRVDADSLAADNFTASTGSWVGVVNDAESTGVGTYTTIQGANGMNVTNLAGFGSGNCLSLTNGTQTYYRPFNGATNLTLNGLATGQVLRLSFEVRFTGGFGGADNFSFGFVNFGTTNSILYANVDLSSVGGTSSEFRYRTGSFNLSDAGTTFGSSFTEPTTVSASNYVMQLEVTKTTNGSFTIDYYRDQALAGSTTQTNGSTFATTVGALAISGIAFRHAQVPGLISYLDQVSVTLSSPETPATGSTNTAITLVSGNIQFGFAITSGAVYRIQSTTNLMESAGWSDLAGPLTNTSGESVTYTDTDPSSPPSRIYRISSP